MDCNGRFQFTDSLLLIETWANPGYLGRNMLMRSTVTTELVLCLLRRETIERLGRRSATRGQPELDTTKRQARVIYEVTPEVQDARLKSDIAVLRCGSKRGRVDIMGMRLWNQPE